MTSDQPQQQPAADPKLVGSGPTRGPAAHAQTPLLFLERAVRMFAERTAVIDGPYRATYRELDDQVRRQAAALRAHGLAAGSRVAVLAPNSAGLLQAHYAVPGAGLVLVALNHRLSAPELSAIVAHAGADLLLFDADLADLAGRIEGVEAIDFATLDARAASCAPDGFVAVDENALLAINYTSGTTGRPKGVQYQHRGAWVQAMAMAYHGKLGPETVHLWTLPMFHCNGWCFTWAVTAAGGTHLCLRKIDAAEIWRHLREDGVTSMNAAPTVLAMLAWGDDADGDPAPRPVLIGTGGAPPSPALLARMAELRLEVTHLYGLTETYGPAVVCDWQPEWDGLELDDRARRMARQGSGNLSGVAVRVRDQDGTDVPADGETQGEVQVRGDNVMLGYYRDEAATSEAFTADGWFRTGDLAVLHPGGYFELRDREKDVIISGGENIASVEVEQALADHPAVLEVAVVSMPDERWGEVPLAHVTLKPGAEITVDELLDHARTRLARFKVPKRVVFGPLPKTSTGKIQKFALREQAWEGQATRIAG